MPWLNSLEPWPTTRERMKPVLFAQADIARKELVLSERQVAAAEALGRVSEGDVIEGVVTGVEDYGAFIQVG